MLNFVAETPMSTDIRLLGLILVDLMEPGASLRNPNQIVLENSTWSSEIRNFLKRAEMSDVTTESLLPVSRKTLLSLLK